MVKEVELATRPILALGEIFSSTPRVGMGVVIRLVLGGEGIAEGAAAAEGEVVALALLLLLIVDLRRWYRDLKVCLIGCQK